MDPASLANGTQPNKEYDNQFVWDDKKHEPIKDLEAEPLMETTEEDSVKRKANDTASKPENTKNKMLFSTPRMIKPKKNWSRTKSMNKEKRH
eukprot:15137483-Ditylum_brightwellii.AAC.1